MAEYIILDTCIYQELGFNFHERSDFINLINFSMATNGEVLLSELVGLEFESHYRQELSRKQMAYQKSLNAFKRDAFFDSAALSDTDISDQITKAVEGFRERLTHDPRHNIRMVKIGVGNVDPIEIFQFIVKSRELGVISPEVKDYLIYDSILRFSLANGKTTTEKIGKRKIELKKASVTFITKDSVFHTNTLFVALKEQYAVDNLQFFSSIPEYLHTKGYNLPFVTADLISKRIKNTRILSDLTGDIKALLSYVSPLFTEKECDEAEVIKKEISEVDMIEFYSYKDHEDDQYKFVVHLAVTVDVVFNAKFKGAGREHQRFSYLETYDVEQRAVFNAPILFVYSGSLNIETETIKSVRLVDFMPWVYIQRIKLDRILLANSAV